MLLIHTACNAVLREPQGVHTIRNFGRRINCTVTNIFPLTLRILASNVGAEENVGRTFVRGHNRHNSIQHQSPLLRSDHRSPPYEVSPAENMEDVLVIGAEDVNNHRVLGLEVNNAPSDIVGEANEILSQHQQQQQPHSSNSFDSRTVSVLQNFCYIALHLANP